MIFNESIPPKKQKILSIQLAEYKQSLDVLEPDELEALEAWVGAGNSPYCNERDLLSSCGTPLDFISGYRYLRGKDLFPSCGIELK